ncbi:hypothetical protein KML24001_16660 [Alistipes onderdonkii subsp. vulgaris]
MLFVSPLFPAAGSGVAAAVPASGVCPAGDSGAVLSPADARVALPSVHAIPCATAAAIFRDVPVGEKKRV